MNRIALIAMAVALASCAPRVIPEERVAELRRECEAVGGYFLIHTIRNSTTAHSTSCLRK